jgi:hypothetical protein
VLWRCESRVHPVCGKQNKVGGNIMIRREVRRRRNEMNHVRDAGIMNTDPSSLGRSSNDLGTVACM